MGPQAAACGAGWPEREKSCPGRLELRRPAVRPARAACPTAPAASIGKAIPLVIPAGGFRPSKGRFQCPFCRLRRKTFTGVLSQSAGFCFFQWFAAFRINQKEDGGAPVLFNHRFLFLLSLVRLIYLFACFKLQEIFFQKLPSRNFLKSPAAIINALKGGAPGRNQFEPPKKNQSLNS